MSLLWNSVAAALKKVGLGGGGNGNETGREGSNLHQVPPVVTIRRHEGYRENVEVPRTPQTPLPSLNGPRWNSGPGPEEPSNPKFSPCRFTTRASSTVTEETSLQREGRHNSITPQFPPMTQLEWSSVTSPGFSTRAVRAYEDSSSPFREQNQNLLKFNGPTSFELSPHQIRGRLPYVSKWRRKKSQPPTSLPSTLQSLTRSRYSPRNVRQGYNPETGSVFCKITPLDGVSFLNHSMSDSSNDSKMVGLGGTLTGSVTNKLNRLWPSANNPVYDPSKIPTSPTILEALANRKRNRNLDSSLESSPKKTPVADLSYQQHDVPIANSSKRAKFIPASESGKSLATVPITNFHLLPSDENMTSESILEQMNQTEKRFLPDDDSPPYQSRSSIKKQRVGGLSPRTSTPNTQYRKRRVAPLEEIEERESTKSRRLCDCTECYEEAAGISRKNSPTPISPIKPETRDISSIKTSARNMNLTPEKKGLLPEDSLRVKKDKIIGSPCPMILRSPNRNRLPSGLIDREMYEADRRKKAERLRTLLDLSITEYPDPVPSYDQIDTSSKIKAPNCPSAQIQSSLPNSSTSGSQNIISSQFTTTETTSSTVPNFELPAMKTICQISNSVGFGVPGNILKASVEDPNITSPNEIQDPVTLTGLSATNTPENTVKIDLGYSSNSKLDGPPSSGEMVRRSINSIEPLPTTTASNHIKVDLGSSTSINSIPMTGSSQLASKCFGEPTLTNYYQSDSDSQTQAQNCPSAQFESSRPTSNTNRISSVLLSQQSTTKTTSTTGSSSQLPGITTQSQISQISHSLGFGVSGNIFKTSIDGPNIASPNEDHSRVTLTDPTATSTPENTVKIEQGSDTKSSKFLSSSEAVISSSNLISPTFTVSNQTKVDLLGSTSTSLSNPVQFGDSSQFKSTSFGGSTQTNYNQPDSSSQSRNSFQSAFQAPQISQPTTGSTTFPYGAPTNYQSPQSSSFQFGTSSSQVSQVSGAVPHQFSGGNSTNSSVPFQFGAVPQSQDPPSTLRFQFESQQPQQPSSSFSFASSPNNSNTPQGGFTFGGGIVQQQPTQNTMFTLGGAPGTTTTASNQIKVDLGSSTSINPSNSEPFTGSSQLPSKYFGASPLTGYNQPESGTQTQPQNSFQFNRGNMQNPQPPPFQSGVQTPQISQPPTGSTTFQFGAPTNPQSSQSSSFQFGTPSSQVSGAVPFQFGGGNSTNSSVPFQFGTVPQSQNPPSTLRFQFESQQPQQPSSFPFASAPNNSNTPQGGFAFGGGIGQQQPTQNTMFTLGGAPGTTTARRTTRARRLR